MAIDKLIPQQWDGIDIAINVNEFNWLLMALSNCYYDLTGYFNGILIGILFDGK